MMKQLNMVSIGGLIFLVGMASNVALGEPNPNALRDEASQVGLPDPTVVRIDNNVTVGQIRAGLLANCKASPGCAASLAADKDYARGNIPAYDPSSAPSMEDLKRGKYRK